MGLIPSSRVLRFNDAVAAANLWLAAGGGPRVDIGAMEPLLWRDGRRRIADLVHALRDLGTEVRMTTNASLLAAHARALAEAGLTRLRVSWHTCSPDLFRALSGGYGDYDAFLRGVEAAALAAIPLTFNRVLLRDRVSDLPEQIDRTRRLGARLKLYDLLWTPGFAADHARHFVSAGEVAAEHVIPILGEPSNVLAAGAARDRWTWQLPGGGEVAVKASGAVDRSAAPCASCAHRDRCLEAFGEYVRVGPALRLYCCYLRRDVGFDLRPWLGGGSAAGEGLFSKLDALLAPALGARDVLAHAPLRLTVIDACNFHCTVPGSRGSWCLEETPATRMPPIRMGETDT